MSIVTQQIREVAPRAISSVAKSRTTMSCSSIVLSLRLFFYESAPRIIADERMRRNSITFDVISRGFFVLFCCLIETLLFLAPRKK
jgi:hypothetical protein